MLKFQNSYLHLRAIEQLLVSLLFFVYLSSKVAGYETKLKALCLKTNNTRIQKTLVEAKLLCDEDPLCHGFIRHHSEYKLCDGPLRIKPNRGATLYRRKRQYIYTNNIIYIYI